jgi:hypothetical protein
MEGSSARSWVRNNILGLVAIFIALNGTALATQVASQAGDDSASGKKNERGAVVAAKGKRGPRGLTGAQGAPGAQGPQGAQGAQGASGPPSGPAGGELAGTYPAPTIGTVTGLDLATSSGAGSPGITFGPGGPKMYNLTGFPNTLAVDTAGGLSVFGPANLTGNTTVGGTLTLKDVAAPASPPAGSAILHILCLAGSEVLTVKWSNGTNDVLTSENTGCT